MDIDMGKLAEMAVTCGEDHEELEESIKAERAEKAKILGQLVEAVRPALTALSSRVPNSSVRGVRVETKSLLRSHKVLYLIETGELVAFEYEGTLGGSSTRKKVLSIWNATDTEQVIAERWLVSEIAKNLATALDAQLGGNNTKRTIEIEQNVETLRAVSTLLGRIERTWR